MEPPVTCAFAFGWTIRSQKRQNERARGILGADKSEGGWEYSYHFPTEGDHDSDDENTGGAFVHLDDVKIDSHRFWVVYLSGTRGQTADPDRR